MFVTYYPYTDIGDVYSWGWNESGQVGLPCLKDKAGANISDESDGRSMVVYPSLLFEDDDEEGSPRAEPIRRSNSASRNAELEGSLAGGSPNPSRSTSLGRPN